MQKGVPPGGTLKATSALTRNQIPYDARLVSETAWLIQAPVSSSELEFLGSVFAAVWTESLQQRLESRIAAQVVECRGALHRIERVALPQGLAQRLKRFPNVASAVENERRVKKNVGTARGQPQRRGSIVPSQFILSESA